MKEYTVVFEIFSKKFRVKIKAHSEKEAHLLIREKVFDNIHFESCEETKLQKDINQANDLFSFLNGFKK